MHNLYANSQSRLDSTPHLSFSYSLKHAVHSINNGFMDRWLLQHRLRNISETLQFHTTCHVFVPSSKTFQPSGTLFSVHGVLINLALIITATIVWNLTKEPSNKFTGEIWILNYITWTIFFLRFTLSLEEQFSHTQKILHLNLDETTIVYVFGFFFVCSSEQYVTIKT